MKLHQAHIPESVGSKLVKNQESTIDAVTSNKLTRLRIYTTLNSQFLLDLNLHQENVLSADEKIELKFLFKSICYFSQTI